MVTPVLPGTQPALPVPQQGQAVLPMTMSTPAINARPMPFANFDYNTMLQGSLERFMDPNSAHIQQARQRGMEQAAVRGGVNSSIAAGAAERAALDTAVPLAQTAAGMQAGAQQAQIQDWLSQQGFNRELAAAPYQSSMAMLGRITELGMQDPELYTPSVVSGFTNFFNQSMNSMIRRYFNGQ